MEQKTTYPITGHVEVPGLGRIPVLSIRMMDDERERELAARSIQRRNENAGEE